MHTINKFGPITLFGSGETLPASGAAYEYTAKQIEGNPGIAVVETPAGFQPNSEVVARKVAQFITSRLQNHHPRVQLIPARKNEGELSTNNADLLEPMLSSNWIFLGPGSPTYAVRNLQDSLLLTYLYAMHRAGCALTLSSAGVLAMSAWTLPVYEIYKVGENLHWVNGLNFFHQFGLDIAFIPHWNNNSGGDELDTSHCFMGHNRFNQLKSLIPNNIPIIGIDEQTALTITFQGNVEWKITGNGNLTILHEKKEYYLPKGVYDPSSFGFDFLLPKTPTKEIQALVDKIEANREKAQENHEPPVEVIRLAEIRRFARSRNDWKTADASRTKIVDLGWEILDTPDGYRLKKI